MESKFKLPPVSKRELSTPEELAEKLSPLVGQTFPLTRVSRTDGSNLRKLIAATLSSTTPVVASKSDFTVVPTRGKGVPKALLEYIDTYIVTSGKVNYNLQVWNRNPASDSVQVEYANGETLSANEVRFITVKVNPETHIIESVLVLTPDYIVENFGKFGKPTIKSQMIISNRARQNVIAMPNSTLFYASEKAVGNQNNISNLSSFSIKDEPTESSLLPIEAILNVVVSDVVGKVTISPTLSTKERGQELERLIATKLGYSISEEDLMDGGYPDIRNQALEIKVQDSPTVDLGKYTPEFEENVPSCPGFTTGDIRYLIALTNGTTGLVEGVVLCEGNKLGSHFTYIASESYKCQRGIPMAFFESHAGKSAFNP
ncbi:nuclease [Photobacterium leiognathi]|uniref:nuclease n=1 Tax=Photobacterium leiognathi TaxID=553611 RepID=UPI002980BC70|nr:nuclease [Photobacterium leiognathi]